MISRGIAAFLGGFTLLNLLGDLFAPGFDANIWWIDFSPLPPAVANVRYSLAESRSWLMRSGRCEIGPAGWRFLCRSGCLR